jgi:hypothetical protein
MSDAAQKRAGRTPLSQPILIGPNQPQPQPCRWGRCPRSVALADRCRAG